MSCFNTSPNTQMKLFICKSELLAHSDCISYFGLGIKERWKSKTSRFSTQPAVVQPIKLRQIKKPNESTVAD